MEFGNLGNADLSDSDLVQILASELTCCVTSGHTGQVTSRLQTPVSSAEMWMASPGDLLI